jgi:hypothetical protein
MADTFQSILLGGVSGVVSALITLVSTRSRMLLELAFDQDKELRKSRLETYRILWEMLEPLARYSRTTPITVATVEILSKESRDWYFKTGGIFLSRRSRRPYFRWKARMQLVLERPKHDSHAPRTLRDADVDSIVRAASRLRDSLSDDIGTRRGPLL